MNLWINTITKIVLSIILLIPFSTEGQHNTIRGSNFSGTFVTLDFVEYIAKVHVVDSQYLLIVNVSVTNDKQISFKGKRLYQNLLFSRNSSEYIYFEKFIRGIPVNILSPGFRDVFEEYDVGEVIVDKLHPLNDTVLLDNFIPLEIGSYRIGLKIKYTYKNEKYLIEILETPFDVTFIPPKSIYK